MNLLKQRYEVQRKLGKEGLAATFIANDSKTGKKCVVKTLSLKSARKERQIDLFEREANVLLNLDHPQIPDFIDYFKIETENDVQFCLVQEYVDGRNLAELMEQGRHFTEKEVIDIALSLAEILLYLHSFSPPVIHRDIKPSNIMIGEDKKVYLIDFGAVKDTVMQIDKIDPTVVGTYGYMPMEQFGGRVVPASDVYSLGMTMINMLSHKEPADIKRTKHKLDFRPYVKISEELSHVLDKMVDPGLDKRYRDAQSVKNDLEKVIKGEYRIRKPGINKRLLFGAFIVAIAFAFIIFYFHTPQIKQEYPADFNLGTSIHLISPFDNSKEVTGTPTFTSGNIKFEWEPIGEDVVYDYVLERRHAGRIITPHGPVDGNTIANKIVSVGSIKETSVTINVPPKILYGPYDFDYYTFKIQAHKNGRTSGILKTGSGDRSNPWFEFMVK